MQNFLLYSKNIYAAFKPFYYIENLIKKYLQVSKNLTPIYIFRIKFAFSVWYFYLPKIETNKH